MKTNKIEILLIIIIAVILFGNYSALSQNFENKKSELKDKIINQNDSRKQIYFNNEAEKSPSISAVLSLILPGAGHFYAGRMDVGKYFLTAEAGLWLGIIGVNIYGDAIKEDSRSFAAVHSGINKNGKDDEFFVNIGLFNNIYEYNNYRLSRGEFDKLYDINSHFWNWDFNHNRELYDEQRKKSERIYNSDRIFTAGLIINRIASAVSAFLLTNSSSGLKISSGFNKFVNGKPSGIEIKLTKLF